MDVNLQFLLGMFVIALVAAIVGGIIGGVSGFAIAQRVFKATETEKLLDAVYNSVKNEQVDNILHFSREALEKLENSIPADRFGELVLTIDSLGKLVEKIDGVYPTANENPTETTENN